MTLYRYKAVTPAGDTLEGQMDAGSADEVIVKVQEAGNIPLSAEEADAAMAGGLFGGLMRKSAMNAKQVTAFTDQLATLMGAGQPLDRLLERGHPRLGHCQQPGPAGEGDLSTSSS